MNQSLKITLAAEEELPALEPLFVDMYAQFFAANGQTRLSEGGFGRWCKNYGRSKGVSRAVYLAQAEGEIAGFIEGLIRISPSAVNPEKSGHTAHLYVSPDFRRQGIAAKLHEAAQGWFAQKKVQSETLEVVYQNHGADAFWLSRGFHPVFINYTRDFRLD